MGSITTQAADIRAGLASKGVGMARSRGIPTVVIVRALITPESDLRILAPDEGELRHTPASAFDWALIAQADAIVAITG